MRLGPPPDQVRFKIIRLLLRDRPRSDGNARLGHRIRAPGHQGVPGGQVLALRQQAVGAGAGHPVERREIMRVQLNAHGHQPGSFAVAGATAVAQVQQPTGDVGPGQRAGVGIPELVQATLGAASRSTGHRLAAEQGFFGQPLVFVRLPWIVVRHGL